MRRIYARLLMSFVFLLALAAGSPALAALTEVGPAIDPHGYPQYYGDANGLRLQLCQDGDGVNGLCIFDPVNPDNPESVALGVGDESFWWMASAFINDGTVPDPQGLDAELTLALEGAFGGIGVARDGDQIAFGRIRIRVDTPVAGTYTVTHPYGIQQFEVTAATLGDGINYTKDIGAINVLAPAAGFAGALRAEIGPFLTWPNYQAEPTLQVPVLDGGGLPTGEILQYVGDPQVPHIVTGSIFTEPGAAGPANYFRIQGPEGSNIDVTTDLFEVMGKVLPEPPPAATLHVFPPPPPQNLFAVGPVNRAAPFITPTTGTITGFEVPGSPIGFPLWYQENAGTPEAPVGGLRLAVCPPSNLDPMCISAPIEEADPASVALGVGEEAFWWSAEGFINENTADITALPAGLDGQVTLALEAAFGGTGVVNEGDQIAFGRVRVRVDIPAGAEGTYTITHPYGVEVIENVTAADGINFTRDLGVINPLDPDGAFIGGLYSNIGPKFLTWPDYQLEPSLLVGGNQYIGDPAVAHAVTGSTFIPVGETEPANYFRIQGPEGSNIDVTTSLFVVSGKVFAPVTVPVQVSVFRDGKWLIDNGNGIWEPALDLVKRYGQAGDIPVTGDWNGDGIIEIGVFRAGTWILDADGDLGRNPNDLVFKYGLATDKPITGDWNGDGTTDVGFVRAGKWFFDNGDRRLTAADQTTRYGLDGDIPVTGDWNGDGTTDIGFFRDGVWVLDFDSDRIRTPNELIYRFGQAGDKPVVGDWNFDGIDEIGIFRNGAWYFDVNGNGILEPGIDAGIARFILPSDTPVIYSTGGTAQ